jgi:hypothetical protein
LLTKIFTLFLAKNSPKQTSHITILKWQDQQKTVSQQKITPFHNQINPLYNQKTINSLQNSIYPIRLNSRQKTAACGKKENEFSPDACLNFSLSSIFGPEKERQSLL